MLIHKGAVPLKTKRLVLRQFTLHDKYTVYHNMTSDAHMTKYLSWDTHESLDTTIEMLTRWITGYENPEFYRWAIEYENEVVGSIHLLDISNKSSRCDLGYYIGSKWWNMGIVTEAADEVIRFAFEELGMHKIVAWHHSDNAASGHVMKKLGLILEGTLRKDTRLKNGTYSDVKTYGLLLEDWNTERSNRLYNDKL
ncbi:GNAT family N-acetyltransferase [Paenibacillus sp. UNC451MF]|uniref:GNAT family N-acetyltransferase n=1 Tax=Paenibacillus sp. UNC451MF TaxID=1449063 RepID=UPI0004902335|nr:GNAT family protein [Paenibacillus sp. UNC451MF]